MLGFVEPSCVWSSWWLDSNNVAWFLMGDFLRLNPWNEGLGRQAQAVLHKYCLVCVIVFLWRVFSLFLFLTGWEFQVNSLQKEPRLYYIQLQPFMPKYSTIFNVHLSTCITINEVLIITSWFEVIDIYDQDPFP